MDVNTPSLRQLNGQSIVITRFGGTTETVGDPVSYPTWAGFCHSFMGRALTVAEKGSAPTWSAAQFEGNRRSLKNVIGLHLLALDYDSGTLSFDSACSFWAGASAALSEANGPMACLVHTTFSHRDAHPKFRVIMPLSRSVSAEEYSRLWSWVNHHASNAGHVIDRATKDASRIWIVPAAPEGRVVRFFAESAPTSLPIDVDHVLGRWADLNSHQEHKRNKESSSPKGSAANLARFEERLRALRDAPEGERNGALYNASLLAGGLIAWTQVDEEQAMEAIRDAGLEAGLDDEEIERTMLRAISCGRDSATDRGAGNPRIQLSDSHHKLIQEVMKIIGARDDLFVRDERLVCVVQNRADGYGFIPISDTRLQELLSESICFFAKSKKKEKRVGPPLWLAQSVLKRGSWQGYIRSIRAVAPFPVLDPYGNAQSSGYSESTQTFSAINDSIIAIPKKPTLEHAKGAVDLLLDIVCDFPFVDNAHRSAFLALLLSPLSRYMHDGNIPLGVIQANDKGVGKSMLSSIISIIVTGTSSAPMMVQAKGSEEERKRIGALLLMGHPLIIIDNVDRPLGGANMNALITARTFEDRYLGKHQVFQAENNATWIANGQNITLAADTSRRVLQIRLQCNDENPELRASFKHRDLLKMVTNRRAEYLSAALTILKAYASAGFPKQEIAPWGSFEGWSRIVRGALTWAGLPDPALTRNELAAEADLETELEVGIIEGLFEMQERTGNSTGMRSTEILKHLEGDRVNNRYATLSDALATLAPPGQHLPSPTKFGARLRQIKRKIRNGKILIPVESTNKKDVLRWLVKEAA